ncbi:MAG TPA: M14 family metallopeptidase, partial [Blastocatellia bacterium]|nr:M14 family metallopeptidase [Blastocatellia bacterium]
INPLDIKANRKYLNTVAPRRLAIASIILIALALLIASAFPRARVSAYSSRARQQVMSRDASRIEKQSNLKSRLASASAAEFEDALAALESLDEPGALEVWRAALKNQNPQFQKQAWSKYRNVQSELARKEFIPQIARINAPSDEVLRIANSSGLELTIWKTSGGETVAAASPYLIERLRNEGMNAAIIYDSVADWQRAREGGDALASAITPEYQSESARESSQVRVAVIDLANRNKPAAGYSDWFGDRENILMREGSLIAYLDIFSSDGSPSSINAHIQEQYVRRGYRVAGFYTREEFSSVAPRLFPGKSFDSGLRAKTKQQGAVVTLANDHYHNYQEVVDEFKALASSHPDIARYVKLGESYEGRDIFALKITSGASADESSKPDVLITGCHHAREWISVETPVHFANQLVNGYATDTSIKYMVDRLQIWIVPIVNPDGFVFSQSSPGGPGSGDKLWRKNRRPISVSGCVSNVGVDLNRNYDFQWRLRGDNACEDYCDSDRSCINDDVGASDDPRNIETYRGPGPDSEPEIKAIKSLVDDPDRHFRAELDYHNYGQLVLYPWGYQRGSAPDNAMLSDLAQKMSKEIKSVNNRIYTPQPAFDLYVTTGTSSDYAYGVNKVAVPIVVEMRPICCDFELPEEQIAGINAENWAGARTILNWAAGPPFLESVKVYSMGSDGTFSKLIYSARWIEPAEPTTSERQLVFDTRFPGIEPGQVQVVLQFSKSMNTSLPARATLGRDGRTDELTLVTSQANAGWRKTVYENDTWVGETIITQDGNETSAWRLAVAATDKSGLNLDAAPDSIADYATGTGHWINYEDSNKEGTDGGTDNLHVLAPTFSGDFPDVFVASPVGGERLIGGETFNVAWTVPKESGFIPVQQELYLSTDGGVNYERIVEGLPGNVESYLLTIPKVSTTRARIRLLAIEGIFGNALTGDSQADFTIGANVGSGVDIKFLSSEKMSVNWSDTASDNPASGALRFVVNISLTNRGSIPIANLFLSVADLNRGNVLLNRDPKTSPSVGARLSVDVGDDNILSPGETAQARLLVGIVSKKKFNLAVEMYGVAVEGTIIPSSSTKIWSGKPKNR